MARKKAEAKPTMRTIMARNPELKEVARRFAGLALAQLEQDMELSIRQIEQLRRGLATVGEAIGWSSTTASPEDALVEASKDVLKMAKSGAKAMAKDLAEELAEKKVEVRQIVKSAKEARKLGESKKTEYPYEFTYHFTVRDSTQQLVTKVDTLTWEDGQGAINSADAIERGLPGRTKLSDLMIAELQKKQKREDVMTKNLPEYVKFARPLLQDVLANLQ
jgi:hypothetical protein